MKVTILSVGKLDRPWWTDSYNWYAQRVASYTSLNLIELKEPNFLEINKNVTTISRQMIELLTNKFASYTKICLAIHGSLWSSVDLAKRIEHCKDFETGQIVFVIGGSDGLTSEAIRACNYQFSFGNITLPHQLCRVVLVEQIYRAFKIINHEKYHK